MYKRKKIFSFCVSQEELTGMTKFKKILFFKTRSNKTIARQDNHKTRQDKTGQHNTTTRQDKTTTR